MKGSVMKYRNMALFAALACLGIGGISLFAKQANSGVQMAQSDWLPVFKDLSDDDEDDDDDETYNDHDDDDDDDDDETYNDHDDDDDDDEHDADDHYTPPPVRLPSGYVPDEGRLLASHCFQCHGTNGYSTNRWDSIVGEGDEMYDDDHPLMQAQAAGYSAQEATLIGKYLNGEEHRYMGIQASKMVAMQHLLGL